MTFCTLGWASIDTVDDVDSVAQARWNPLTVGVREGGVRLRAAGVVASPARQRLTPA